MKDRYPNITPNLYDRDQSSAFYEERYKHGYMDDWPQNKKQRVREIIQSLPLPPEGKAVDFGCGNGVLTEVVREALPGWTVFGTDLSKTAVNAARLRYPACTFFEPTDPDFADLKFNLLFTNHVIEHVYDLDEVMSQMSALLLPSASMLHFLPCGNAGSFEHQVCMLRHDGIDKEMGNRFFYEDKGHVRRLTSPQLEDSCREFGFTLGKAFYSNQHHGAIDWITGSSMNFILNFTDTRQAINPEARKRLLRIRWKLLTLGLMRRPVRILENFKSGKARSITSWLMLLPTVLLYPFSRLIDAHMHRNADLEWTLSKNQSNASGMCIYLERRTTE